MKQSNIIITVPHEKELFWIFILKKRPKNQTYFVEIIAKFFVIS